MNETIRTAKWWRWAVVLLAAATLVVAVVLIAQKPKDGLAMEANATTGLMPGIDPMARQAQLQQQLDESKIAFSMNTSPVFATGADEGNLLLENPGNNAKLMTAQIVLDQTGEVIYESGALRPGTYLGNIRLNKQLARGEYAATVYLKAYREDTQELIGQTGAAITITVKA